jgi:SAM-dependent methyltransferase
VRRRWFIDGRAGWNPSLYEWWFTRNPEKVAIRAREEAGILAALDPLVAPGCRVVEAGAGTGHYTSWMARRGASVLATDASPAMLAALERRVADEALVSVRVRQAELPGRLAEPESADVVVAIGVLNYVADLARALRAFAEVLVPGGSAVFTVPLASPGGRLYAFGEAVSRRRVWTYRAAEAGEVASRCGLQPQALTPLGFTRAGFNLLVVARRPADVPRGAADGHGQDVNRASGSAAGRRSTHSETIGG